MQREQLCALLGSGILQIRTAKRGDGKGILKSGARFKPCWLAECEKCIEGGGGEDGMGGGWREMGTCENLGEEGREGGEIEDVVADCNADGGGGVDGGVAGEDAVGEVVERERGCGGTGGGYEALLHGGLAGVWGVLLDWDVQEDGMG